MKLAYAMVSAQHPARFPRHFQLLLLAVRVPLSGADAEAIRRLVAEDVDWRAFLAVARTHRLSTLALRGLQAAAGTDLPGFVVRELKTRQQINTFRAVRTTLEGRRIVGRMDESGYRLTVLKGTGLSETIYGDPYARHCGDLDLLCAETDLPGVLAQMEGLGYERVEPVCALTPRRLHWYRRYWKDLAFRHKRSGIMVDLHWRLFNNCEHPANRLGSSVDGGPVAYTTVDQFLYCAAHGCSDTWVYLKGLADVAAFLHALSPAELTEALDRARALGLLPQVHCAAQLAAEWMGVEGASPLLLGTDDPRARTLHRTMRAQVLAELERTDFCPERQNPGPLRALRLELHLTGGMRSLLEIAGRYLWRPRTWSVVDLPDRLLWLTPLIGAVIPPRGGGRASARGPAAEAETGNA